MKAGELRHEITIEQKLGTQAASGGPTNAWDSTPVCAIRAKIEPQGGGETFSGGVFNPEATHIITIRYWPGLLPSMRINFKGRLFEILNINDFEERKTWMTIQAKEGRSHGVV